MTTLRTVPASLPFAQKYRRAMNAGLVSGITVVFLILIGLPTGASENEGLPVWFVWGLFLIVTATFAYFAVRPRNPAEERAQNLQFRLTSGVIVGILTAIFAVTFACMLNAFQVWELAQPNGGVSLNTGLPNKVYRVNDIFENVTPRTTALLAGIPYNTIRPADPATTPRADPLWNFFLIAALYPFAGMIGAALNGIVRAARAQRAKQSSKQTVGGWRGWVVTGLPLVFLAFIILNNVLPGTSEGYRNIIGGSAQLAGLLASFLLIASGLLAVRAVSGDGTIGSGARRLLLTVPLTVLFIGLALAAPPRPDNDLLYSSRAPEIIQTPDNQIIITDIPKTPVDTLILYRTVTLIGIGVLFIVGNILGVRGKAPLRSLIAVNILLGSLVVAPLYLDKYQQSVLLLVGINILLGLGLNIVIGYAGLLDLGYVAFYAIGAYTYAFLSSNQDIRQGGQIIALKFAGNDQMVQRVAAMLIFGAIITVIIVFGGLNLMRRRAAKGNGGLGIERPTSFPRWAGPALVALSVILTLLVINLLSSTPLYAAFAGFPAFIIGIICGVMFAAFAGIMLGIPVLRLRGDYLAIVTLGFGEIIRLFLNNIKDVTGGPAGLLSIPKLTIGTVEIASNEGLLYVVLAGCILVALFSLRLRSSRLGRAWGALKSDEDIAQAMGINLVNAKVLAFAIGAGFAGIGGVLFAARQANIFPDNFTLQVSINILALVIIGGMGSVPGVIVGALVLIGIPESLRVFEAYRILAFGALLVAMMLLRPGGLLPQPPQPLEGRARLLKQERTIS